MAITYKDSGVSIENGNSFVKKISPIVKDTFSERVITGIGGFGALFSGKFPEMEEPILVSGTDGVGTKIKIAQKMNIHNTIGIDAVAMCVNDIITSGAKPLFFLDYISCGKLNEDTMVNIVKGIANGCKESKCSLIGGETAEHPNVMDPNEYDIAGFSVGVVDKKDIIDGSTISTNTTIIGLASTGIHSNGYSLVRKLLFDIKGYSVNDKISELGNSLGKTLLEPTQIYTRAINNLTDNKISIQGIVHITGGGFYENIPRILPENIGAIIEKESYDHLPIFDFIQKEGDISEREMFTTFNMGIGMMLFIDTNLVDKAFPLLKDFNPKIIGKTCSFKDERVILK